VNAFNGMGAPSTGVIIRGLGIVEGDHSKIAIRQKNLGESMTPAKAPGKESAHWGKLDFPNKKKGGEAHG